MNSDQKASILWFTGLSGSGKSSTAHELEKILRKQGYPVYRLDGDHLRQGLCSDLGFSDRDRKENIRRTGEVAKLMLQTGSIVLVSVISPFEQERLAIRQSLEPGQFIEIYMSTPLKVCEQRDVKGLYAQARSGALNNFTGIDSPYQAPKNPELNIDTSNRSIGEAAHLIANYLHTQGRRQAV